MIRNRYAPTWLSLSAAVLGLLASQARAQSAGTPSFYFTERETCTLIVDFQAQKAALDALPKEGKALALAKGLIAEFKRQGASNCPDTKELIALAVFIPGVDNYGRPNFGSRVNLLKIKSEISDVGSLSVVDLKNFSDVEREFKSEIFF